MRLLGALSGYLVGAIALGVPIAFALLFSATATGLQMGGSSSSPQIMAAQLMRGTDSVPMMALPFFILTGELMNRGGMTRRIIDVCNVTVGRVRGGLGYVTILACLLFGSLVGSAVASTAALGAILIPMMARAGYNRERSAALVASANLVTPIMPPSVPLIVYGATAGVSISSLFLGGIAPALYLTIIMCAAWFVVAKSREPIRTQVEMPSLGKFIRMLGSAFWALMLPVIILVGLRGGIFTATEAGVVAVVYALIVGGLIYRELDIKILMNGLFSAAMMSAVIMFLAAAAQVAAYYMTISGLPAIITQMMSGFTDSPKLLVLVLMIFVIIVGLILDVIPTILIMTPIVVPVLTAAGVDLIYFGIVFTLANVIGLVTPPVGPSLNVACATGKVKMAAIIPKVMPYFIAQTILVFLFVAFPELILTPLRWLGG